MTSPMLVWDGALGLGPYRVGEVLPPEMQPPEHLPRKKGYGTVSVDLEDEELSLSLCGGVLVYLTTTRNFWVDGENLIGVDAEWAIQRHFGGAKKRDDFEPFSDIETNTAGIEVFAYEGLITRVSFERFDLIPDVEPDLLDMGTLVSEHGGLLSQREVCIRLGVRPMPAPASFTADVTEGALAAGVMLNGMRERSVDGDTGWSVWPDKRSGEPRTPLQVSELVRCRPEVEPLLAMPPGWRFTVVDGQVTVWMDEDLLVE